MECLRCGRVNADGADVCSRCGTQLRSQRGGPAQEEEPADRCHWHPNEPTQLACGRCGRPVCHRCVRLGSAGPRCKECARHNVALRPAGVAYEARAFVVRIFRASPWLTLLVALALLSALGGGIRGCARTLASPAERFDPPSSAVTGG